MPNITGARFLAESLEGYGVTHVFFVPMILPHTLAEMEKRTSIKRVMPHSEKSAVYMADGYARATGRPGVCMAQTIGAANLAAGLRDPFLACSPVIALTGGPSPETRSRHTYQQIEDAPLFKPVTKHRARVDSVERLPDVLRQAFREATTGTPGPVHVELLGHFGEIEKECAPLEVVPEPRFGRVPPFRPQADRQSVAEAAQLLTQACRPIIVAGGGVRFSSAGPELVELAEKLSVPVATSMNAKDGIPGSHPLSVGIPGSYSRKSANRAVLEADLVFFVGSRTGSQVTGKWRVPRPGTAVIQLDISPEELGRHYPNQVSLSGDAKVVLRQLVDATDVSATTSREDWVARVQGFEEEWRREYHGVMHSDAVPMRPERLCRELTDLMPSDALLVVETGHSGMWTAGMVDLNHAGQGYIRAAGSLGWGLPAALGAKLALPDRPVLLFSGDGGFWYHLAEIETAVRWGINAVILINNNRGFSQTIQGYTAAYGGELHGDHADVWRFSDVDFAQIAESMGAKGMRVRKPAELGGALEQAFAADRPCVVEVITETYALAPLAWTGEDEERVE